MLISSLLESTIHEHYKSSTIFFQTRTHVVNISCYFAGPKAVYGEGTSIGKLVDIATFWSY